MNQHVRHNYDESAVHIIWDWNGTLLHDGQHMMASVSHAFETAGLGPVSIQRHQAAFHRPIASFFRALSPKALQDEEVADVMARFQKRYASQPIERFLWSRTRDLLVSMKRSGVSQSVLSMCPQDILANDILDLGLSEFFEHVDGYPGQGPDTKAAHLALHLSRLAPGKVPVLIGDTTDDFAAAVENGIHCALVDRGCSGLEASSKLASAGAPVFRCLIDATRFAVAQARPQPEVSL